MSHRGQISRFDPNSDDWVIYCEQLEQHFLAYDVAENKQVPMLLSSLPADVYTTLRAILSPDIPSSRTYAEIKTLTEYLKPKRSVSTQRYEFHQRGQREGEPVIVYITELQRWSRGHKAQGQGLGHKYKCFLKKKGLKKFFPWISKKMVWKNIFQPIYKIFNHSKNSAVLEPRTGQFSRT